MGDVCSIHPVTLVDSQATARRVCAALSRSASFLADHRYNPWSQPCMARLQTHPSWLADSGTIINGCYVKPLFPALTGYPSSCPDHSLFHSCVQLLLSIILVPSVHHLSPGHYKLRAEKKELLRVTKQKGKESGTQTSEGIWPPTSETCLAGL